MIIKDPSGPFDESNIASVGAEGPERCPHLRGDVPGEYSCFVHEKKWYPETPCFQYQSHWPERNCPMGEYFIEKFSREKAS